MRTSSSGRLSIGAAVLAGALVFCGCAPAVSTPGIAQSSEQNTSEARVDALRDLAVDISFDYELIESNDALAALSDVVLSGTVVDVQDGPRFGRSDDELTDIRSVVVEIRVRDAVKGDVKEGSSVYVVTYAPVDVDAEAWRKALPAGDVVAVYATRSGDGGAEGSGLDAIDWQKGRPAGAPLYVPAVQGLVVQIDDGSLYWPLTDVRRAGDIADALPGGGAIGNLLPGEEEK